jgi:uncharacterized membrane protein
MAKTSTGLEENVAGLLCYLFGLVSGLIFLLLETESRFVRFHAIQSIIVSGFFFILGMFLFWVPFIGWIAWGVFFALWIVLMYKAYQGAMYKLPVAGDLADKWSAKPAKK